MEEYYLVDTLCWLWWHICPGKLSSSQSSAIADINNKLYFSVASAWEINLKYNSGKLVLPEEPFRYVRQRINACKMNTIDIKLGHSTDHLPPHHQDPFDRIIISQAQQENLTIITHDEIFARYDVKLLM